MITIYEYRCRVIRVIDGDTLAVAVDLGCDVSVTMTVRLYGVNCPEMHGESKAAGEAAKAFTEEWLDNNHSTEGWFELRTFKDKKEKYGRYLAKLYTVGGIVPLNDHLIANGHAVAYTP